MFKKIAFSFIVASSLALAGCDDSPFEQEGPLEKAGEKADEAITDFQNKVEDTCENIKDSVNAEDKNC